MDRKFRLPRIWSNMELRKFAPLFTGDIVNVSGWKDMDKEGGTYRSYFSSASSYTITNYVSEARGFQGGENEIFLDLTKELPQNLVRRYNVAFNHTTLEHIFECEKAFSNICLLSRDVVIVVVPFLQEMHGEYGDYWRFTPLAVQKLFELNGYTLLYLNFNQEDNASVYIFAIGTRHPQNWANKIPYLIMRGLGGDKKREVIGYNVIVNIRKKTSKARRVVNKIKNIFK